jgi:thiamine-monophosphate kinase
MDEFDLITRCFASMDVRRHDVHLGIGDDGAVTRMAGAAADLVLVTDTLVAGVHFPPDTPAAALGHRALAVNLSDIAAMGAAPAWALLALTLPTADPRWLDDFAGGFAALAGEHDVALIGGDTTSGPTLTITVTLIGQAQRDIVLTRQGAAPGDAVCVTGTIGDAAAGLALLQKPGAADTGIDRAAADWLEQRFLYPTPRVTAGQALAGQVRAAIDISDGLLGDAHKLATASHVDITLEASALPCSPALLAWTGDRTQAEQVALSGGDDYELLFTLPEQLHGAIDTLAQRCAVPITRIGRVCAVRAGAAPGASAVRDGRPLALDTAGYRHFR